ncbi:MAG: hypothetical protein AAF736_03520, partial [Pseudomonadota bacterium]
TLLERELEYLMEIWPGDYDNREQVQFDFNVGRRSPAQGGPGEPGCAPADVRPEQVSVCRR